MRALRITWMTIAICAMARVAHATPPLPPTTPPDEATDAEAKRHFDRGLELYAAKSTDQALVEFLESYRLGGHASALKNAAQCLVDEQKLADAYEAYDALLSRHGPQLKDEDRDAANAALADLRRRTGSLEITGDPEAKATVDDKPLQVGAPPQRIDVGHHMVKATKEGFAPFSEDVEITADNDFVVEIQLQPTTPPPPPVALQPPTPPPSPARDHTDRYAGFYAQGSLFLPIALRKQAHVNDDSSQNISYGSPFGLGAMASAGYALSSAIAFEAAGAFMFNRHADKRQLNGFPEEDYTFSDVGGFLGGGARFTTEGDVLRATLGIDIGLSIRSFSISRDMGQTPFSASAGFVEPSFLLNGGVLIGNTPGIKFFAGLMMWLDFAGDALGVGPDTSAAGLSQDAYTVPGKGYLVTASGIQAFVGPTLGIRYGK